MSVTCLQFHELGLSVYVACLRFFENAFVCVCSVSALFSNGIVCVCDVSAIRNYTYVRVSSVSALKKIQLSLYSLLKTVHFSIFKKHMVLENIPVRFERYISYRLKISSHQ